MGYFIQVGNTANSINNVSCSLRLEVEASVFVLSINGPVFFSGTAIVQDQRWQILIYDL